MNEQNHSDFEFGDERQPVTITVRGRSATYLVRDISAAESDTIFAKIITGDEEEKRQAQRDFRDKVISTCVLRADGTPISIEDARRFRGQLAAKLAAAALDFLNPKDVDAKKD